MSDTLEQPEADIAAESGPAGTPEPSSTPQDESSRPGGLASPGAAALAPGLAAAACGASNPSPDYVRRVAQAFDDNGSGVGGDLRAVFKAVLLDDEALSPASLASTTFGKLRETMLRFAQWGRTFGARSDRGA